MQADTRLLETAVQGLCQEAAALADSTMLEDWARMVHAYAMRIVQRPPDPRRLRALWEVAGASLARPWTLPELARTAGMGAEQLRRVCLKETGRSPMQHLTSLRITRATALLATGRSVKEVAPAVGYQNEFAFSSTYCRWTGNSPSSIRKPR
jgi:transcriptional regulator GlxA family with amidase domain